MSLESVKLRRRITCLLGNCFFFFLLWYKLHLNCCNRLSVMGFFLLFFYTSLFEKFKLYNCHVLYIYNIHTLRCDSWRILFVSIKWYSLDFRRFSTGKSAPYFWLYLVKLLKSKKYNYFVIRFFVWFVRKKFFCVIPINNPYSWQII